MIALASCLVIIRLEVRKRLPSVSWFWTSTNPSGRFCRCYNIHLLLWSLVFILTIAFVLLLFLLLLHLLLLPRPFINKENVERIVNQLVFVCYASAGIKTTLLTELGLRPRSIIA
jgi:hypothetical protein